MKTFVLLLVLISPLLSIAQEKGDVGFIYNTYEYNRINLDYRKTINKHYKLKLGIVGGQYSGRPTFNPNIFYGSDSLITYKFFAKSTSQIGLKIGGERKLQQSIFSIGADVLLSYRDEKNFIYKSNYVFDDSLKRWELESTNKNGYGFKNPNNPKVRRSYFVPQVQFSFSMDLPIVQNLYLNMYIGGLFAFPILINESEKYDPFNEYEKPKNISTFDMTSQAGLGVRYAF
jgi:hypothetical protein